MKIYCGKQYVIFKYEPFENQIGAYLMMISGISTAKVKHCNSLEFYSQHKRDKDSGRISPE